ncbi:MAG: peptidoglycan DD-metalloendopeptidase family protein [Clostridia bacterium]|nr:peptidoglycan DD-metalloendopeptidase family protein [Clostridia bacterium]
MKKKTGGSLSVQIILGWLKVILAVLLFPAAFTVWLVGDLKRGVGQKFSDLYKSFRGNSLGVFDSFYNALCIKAAERLEASRKTVAGDGGFYPRHPLGSKNFEVKYEESRFWKGVFTVLTKLPYLVSRPFAAVKRVFRRTKKTRSSAGRSALIKRRLRDAAVWIIPAAAAAILAVYMSSVLSSDINVSAEVNGVSLGGIGSAQELNSAVRMVEDKASSVLGVSFVYPYKINYSFSDDVKTDDSHELYSALMNSIGEYVTPGYVVYVDSVRVAALRTREEIETALDEITSQQRQKYHGISAGIVNTVQIANETVPTQMMTDVRHLKELLLYGSSSYSAIGLMESFTDAKCRASALPSQTFALPLALDALSRARTAAQALPDEKSSASGVLPVSVRVEREVLVEDILPYQTVTQEDPGMYVGGTEIKTAGKNGRAIFRKNLVYINGEITEETVLTYRVTEEPTDEVALIGTKPIPESKATEGLKVFILPRNDHLNSGFGWRVLNGRREFHKGLDIEAPMRSNIYAALSGEVVQAGPYYSLGNLIVIKHDNGFSTYYAHLDEILVKVGDRVTQGQLVGLSGNTGYTTGPHFHFELHNPEGEAIDPLPYIYSSK